MRPTRYAAALAVLLVAPAAFAFGPHGETGMTMRAQDTRVVATPQWSTPQRATAAFDRLVAATGDWRASWDGDTDVPARLWGAGLAVPGAQRDPAVAADAARALVIAHLDLLAPGAAADDLELVGNSEANGLRTVTFAQRWHGMRVAGGVVMVMIKRDRLFVIGSTALPDVAAIEPSPSAAPVSTVAATAWVTAVTGTTATVTDSDALVVFPEVKPRALAGDAPAIRYTVARPLVVETADGGGRFTVWVDAATGEPLARVSRRIYDGTLTYNTASHAALGPRAEYPAAYTDLTVDGTVVTTDHIGSVVFAAATASVAPGLTGPYISVFDGGGHPAANAGVTLPLAAGASTSWMGTDEFTEGQITTFTHGNVVKQLIRHQLDPFLPWGYGQMAISANENQFCNAYADLDPDQVHFFVAGLIDFGGGQVWNCENTGRMPDVIYHETGHNFHFRSLIETGVITDINGFFFGDIAALSEGMGDTLSTAVTHDAQLGPGFFIGDPNGLRNLNPDGIEKRYPDDIHGEPHDDGEIIGETIWDTRAALVTSLGDAAGQAAANRVFDSIVRHSSMFTTTYTDAIAGDDDDGNLANGTPHQCEISRAFNLHGLAPALAGGVSIGTPTNDGVNFSVPITVPAVDCPGLGVTGVSVTWQVRGDQAQTGSVPLVAAGATWTGAMPALPEGTVLQYQVTITFSDSSTALRPLNQADPYYEAYIGPVTQIFCDDFETDKGWVHTATAGADEWERAPATAPAAGDPIAAASAATIFGTDVTDNGLYEVSSSSTAQTPAIDTTGFAAVRLQYKRWLDVDDGFLDQATIAAGGTTVWSNKAGTDAGTATNVHRDGEWRFQDVDLTAAATTGSVQVTFGLTTDAARNLGGWNMDDVCVVGVGAVCGDMLMRGTEACDDGNTEDGDGCSAICAIEPDSGGCCQTGTDPRGAVLVTAFGAFGLMFIMRRRRRRQP